MSDRRQAAESPADRSRHAADSFNPTEARDARLEHALGLAFRYLNRRDRTVNEMERHLVAHDVESSVAGRALQTLCEQGYLDDAHFTRLFIADKRELEQWGNERIRRSLRGRGIDHDLIDGSLAEGPADSELERALVLLRRRFPSPPQDRRERDRALGVMARKGFDSELAVDALAAYGREAGAASWN
ncbi:MAG: RecX family transcriptional regulator [Solirubrobacteraceae bacterium]